MAISRMNMERQMRNMGGIMGLEDQRQGYFLGKLVKKITKPIKKVVKSPLGKAALIAGLGAYAGGLGPFAKLKGSGFLRGAGSNLLTGLKSREGFLGQLGNVFRVGGEKDADFSALRLLGGGLGAAAIAAPFLMGDDEEVVDEGVDVSGIQPMVANIRQQARDYYQDPTKSALYFMPPKAAVQSSFYAAEGGLADIPRGGYESGEMVMADLSKDPNYKGWLKLYEKNPEAAMMNEKAEEYLRFYNKKAEGGLMDIPREGYDDGGKVCFPADNPAVKDLMSNMKPRAFAANGGVMMASNIENDKILESLFEKYLDMGMSPLDAEKAAREEFEKMTTKPDIDRAAAAEGGLMDLGGMEKDYREGGFVPIGAEERADDVPARLSKNEFVFTADAVRNAGGGDIDKGAEVMQNMMDNLEAGGNISEESQGKENPAQEMFDQAQMLESRIA
jgi:hypothetical protein